MTSHDDRDFERVKLFIPKIIMLSSSVVILKFYGFKIPN